MVGEGDGTVPTDAAADESAAALVAVVELD
jgi:hypothetical protein